MRSKHKRLTRNGDEGAQSRLFEMAKIYDELWSLGTTGENDNSRIKALKEAALLLRGIEDIVVKRDEIAALEVGETVRKRLEAGREKAHGLAARADMAEIPPMVEPH